MIRQQISPLLTKSTKNSTTTTKQEIMKTMPTTMKGSNTPLCSSTLLTVLLVFSGDQIEDPFRFDKFRQTVSAAEQRAEILCSQTNKAVSIVLVGEEVCEPEVINIMTILKNLEIKNLYPAVTHPGGKGEAFRDEFREVVNVHVHLKSK